MTIIAYILGVLSGIVVTLWAIARDLHRYERQEAERFERGQG